MKIIIRIECDNAVFVPQCKGRNPYRGYEVARILQELAKEVRDGQEGSLDRKLQDINGHVVGQCEAIEDEDTPAPLPMEPLPVDLFQAIDKLGKVDLEP